MSNRLKAVLVLALALLLCAGVLAGCPAKKAAAPVGGKVAYGMLEEPDMFDPYATNMSVAVTASNLVYDGLTKPDEKLTVVPWLAEEVPTLENGGISKDGMTITYKLRKGVKWHDGKPFTSADVKATWELLVNPKYIPVTRIGYEDIKEVDASDPNVVVFKMKKVHAPFVNNLFQYAIYPKHILDKDSPAKPKWRRNPIGTGPFKFKEWKAGEFMRTVRNDDYFMGKPPLDEVIVRFYKNDAGLLSALKTGEIDVWEMVTPSLVPKVEALPDLIVQKPLGVYWENYGINCQAPLLKDAKVRRALWMGCDRKTIVDKLYPGEWKGDVAVTDQYPTNFAYNKNIKPVEYDVEGAKALLEEAGWKEGPDGIRMKDGKRLSISISTTTGKVDRERKQVMLQEQWKKIGVELKIKNYDADTMFAAYEDGGILLTGKYDIAIFAWVAQVDPDDASLWGKDQIPSKANPTGQNSYYWANDEVTKLTKEASQTFDEAKRKENYDRVQELLYEEAPAIFERYWLVYTGINKKVKNFKTNPTNQGNMWNVWEWAKEKAAE